MKIRILSWNIHKGVGGVDRRYRLERIVELLNTQQADVLLLQEVAQDWPGALRENQVERLCSELGFRHHAFGHEHRFKIGGYGNLILSRFPIQDVHHLDLTISWRKKRGALLARILSHAPDAEGHMHQRSVWVTNMHLGLSQTERALQLARFFDEHPYRGIHSDTPVILGGDLNDLYGSLGPRFLEPAGFQRIGPRHNTFPAFAPVRPLDGLFGRGNLKIASAGIARGPHFSAASDHLPLVAELELDPTRASAPQGSKADATEATDDDELY